MEGRNGGEATREKEELHLGAEEVSRQHRDGQLRHSDRAGAVHTTTTRTLAINCHFRINEPSSETFVH